MRITRLTEHCVQVTLLGFVNVFLVREADGLTLIDTALLQAKPILAAAAAEKLPIRRIALTHAHNDHAGSLDALKALLPDAEVLISEREARLLRGDRSLDATEPQTKLAGSYTHAKTTPTRVLHEGEMVGSLRVVAAPGHTPGQVAFLDERDGTLFAGDAWGTKAGLTIAGTLRLWFPFYALATWNKPLALETARKLRALGPEILAVGHGDALRAPGAAMQRELDVVAGKG